MTIIDTPAMSLFVVAGFVANRAAGMVADKVADYVVDVLGGSGAAQKVVEVIVRATMFLVALYSTNFVFSKMNDFAPLRQLGLTASQVGEAVGTQAAVLGGSMPGLNTSLDDVFGLLMPFLV